MGNQKDSSNNTQGFYQNIALAVKKLQHFTELKKETLLQKTITFARSFITTTFSRNTRKKQKKKNVQVLHEVLNAIQTIQKHYLFIQKLKKGTEAQQELADLTCQVVERYNKIIYKQKLKHLSFKERLADFIDKKCGLSIDQLKEKAIYLPKMIDVPFCHESQKINQTAVASIQNNEMISNFEADAFRVKAISLLRNHDNMNFRFALDELETIKSTPITACIHSQDLKRIQMTQVLKPFPGEIIIFKGEFKRVNEDGSKSFPLKESFEIIFNSHPTGFPYPSQYTLWALSDSMIPIWQADFDLMPEFSSLLKSKQQVATSLLPKGNLIAKAKEILKIKKEVFQEHLKEILILNSELSLSIYTAVPAKIRPKNGLKVITDFYTHLHKAKTPYNCLLEIQETIIQSFLVEPFEKLKKSFLNKELYFDDINLRYKKSADILKTARKNALKSLVKVDKWKIDFIACMGMLTGDAADAIILQHMSKTIGYRAPQLKLYQQKVQIALYDQLHAFQKELAVEPIEKSAILNQLMINLENDTANFSKTNFETIVSESKKVVLELGEYYKN